MTKKTKIEIDVQVCKKLNSLKQFKNDQTQVKETYSDVIARLIEHEELRDLAIAPKALKE